MRTPKTTGAVPTPVTARTPSQPQPKAETPAKAPTSWKAASPEELARNKELAQREARFMTSLNELRTKAKALAANPNPHELTSLLDRAKSLSDARALVSQELKTPFMPKPSLEDMQGELKQLAKPDSALQGAWASVKAAITD